jgi:hypothetical protein
VLFEKKELIKKISAGCLSNRVAFHPTDSNRQGGFGLKLKVFCSTTLEANFTTVSGNRISLCFGSIHKL